MRPAGHIKNYSTVQYSYLLVINGRGRVHLESPMRVHDSLMKWKGGHVFFGGPNLYLQP
jgi:hypothetical protein